MRVAQVRQPHFNVIFIKLSDDNTRAMIRRVVKSGSSRKWNHSCDWLKAGKECGSNVSSRLWGGALRDETQSGCEGD